MLAYSVLRSLALRAHALDAADKHASMAYAHDIHVFVKP